MTLPTINISSLNGSNGFRLDGAAGGSEGVSVSNAGDINGDGFDDVIIGSPHSDLNGKDSGSSYLVFGKSTAFDAIMDLSQLNGSDGFRLDGDKGDYSGISVSSAGDINGDGLDDVVVGASGTYYNYYSSEGTSYIIFGKTSGFNATFNLSDLDGNDGFRMASLIATILAVL